MSFATPSWLLLILLVPALAWLWALARRDDQKRLDAFVTPAMFDRVGKRDSRRVEHMRISAILAGVVFLALALARPQWGVVRERVERTGVDVAFVLDTLSLIHI